MKKLIYSFILIFLFNTSYSQNIELNLNRYADNYSSERIYLHYDKSTYAAGDTVWFKVYMMKTIFPADDVKTVYIDWTDDNGKLLLHGLSPVEDGASFGQFAIPDNYTGQYLHVKAYTKWMLNFDSSFLYNKDIRVLSKNNIARAKDKIVPELTFFPEGGDAVTGVSNKIAFKANDQYGRPLRIKGTVKDNKGTEVATLKVIHDGMGYFYITPHDGLSYTATWQDEGGSSHSTSLPEIKNSGISLQVGTTGHKRNFLVRAPSNSSFTGGLHLLGTMYGQKVFDFSKELKDGLLEGVIPTETLPSGILTITVFDNQWKPLAERITYVNNQEYTFDPTMTVQHWGLNKRARNEIEISVPDSITANLSVSVTDLAIDADTSDNIISHLFLTGELKGKVNNPAYYFSNNSDSIMQQLDLVMLTHGWRRFDWEKLSKGEFPVIKYPADTSYLSISGKVFGATPAQLRDAGQIILILSQNNAPSQIFPIPLNGDGSFSDPSLILFDTAKIYYQIGKAKKLSDAGVQFMQNRLPPFTNNPKATGLYYNQLADTTGNQYHLRLSDALANEIKFLKGKVLETVKIQAKPKSVTAEMDKKYTSGLFSGGDGYSFDLLDDPFAASSMDIFQYLQGKVAGLQINATSSPPTITWRGGSPQLYLNEMSTDANMISSVPVSDIAYIKVLRPPFMGGVGGGSNGAIAIYTRKGGDVKQEPGKGLSNNLVNGYTAIRQFYSPNYESTDAGSDKKDLRTTLYWNPSVNVIPGKNKVILKFFNNDITNGFRVVIEGMTKDGKLAHLEQRME